MHYSGILVVVPRERFAACARRLDALSDVEVHLRHPESGRLIAVVETESLEAQQETLRRIQAETDVLLAELVFHYRDREAPDQVATATDSRGNGIQRGET